MTLRRYRLNKRTPSAPRSRIAATKTHPLISLVGSIPFPLHFEPRINTKFSGAAPCIAVVLEAAIKMFTTEYTEYTEKVWLESN